jgi:hypothetical protein
MEIHKNLYEWTEARALIDLAAYDKAEQVSRSVALALAYETVHKHPHPEVSYSEQIAIFKRKVDVTLEQHNRAVEVARFHADMERDAHVFKDLEPADLDDEHGGPRYR